MRKLGIFAFWAVVSLPGLFGVGWIAIGIVHNILA